MASDSKPSASAQNGWRKSERSQEKKTLTREGEGQQEEAKPIRMRRGQSQTRRRGKTGQNDAKERGREQELKKKQWNGIGSKQIVWNLVYECLENRLKKY
ncbi:hypothetical protein TNCV_434021 [Trichonephila clavipes]|nr:hypothetical protein TNCV_434021 [Trichonephila clavipes]